MALGTGRQGHPTSGDWKSRKLTDANLPHTVQMGQEVVWKREIEENVLDETLWQREVSRLILKAFLPKTYHKGIRCMNLIKHHANSLVAKMVANVVNSLHSGRFTAYQLCSHAGN